MDRFIVALSIVELHSKVFKIQYGQIYSENHNVSDLLKLYLKSNMDRFIDYCGKSPSRLFRI